MGKQLILEASDNYIELDEYLKHKQVKRCLLVCDASFHLLRIAGYFDSLGKRLGIELVRFGDFQPNPRYESVVAGVELFRDRKCDMIIAVGGGSAIDVAKCIKLYCNLDSGENYLKQRIVPNDVELLAVPTTAGTGSEATRYAVIYYNDEKQSIADESCIPAVVLMDVDVLKTLPDYQRKSTMLDALCHAVEAFWSVNSTEESREYSRQAIRTFMAYWRSYLANEEAGNANMLRAAHLAGKAINLAQTTAGHAMCYKMTSLYGIAHGHAAALCVWKLWPYMLNHIGGCVDPRGEKYLQGIYAEIADAMGCRRPEEAVEVYWDLLSELALPVPEAKEGDFAVLRSSVNQVRLKNHPIRLDEETIDGLYHSILGGQREIMNDR